MKISREFIRKLPKTDLHVHLDGSLRLETVRELAARGVDPGDGPRYSAQEIEQTLVPGRDYGSLAEYLKDFEITLSLMQTPQSLKRIAYELAEDCAAENIRYVEVRFAPQLHMSDRMDLETVLASVNRGLERAAREHNSRPKVVDGREPRFRYGIITCALRSFGKMSDYYRTFFKAHPFSSPKRIFGLASYELIQGVVEVRDRLGLRPLEGLPVRPEKFPP